MFKHIMIAYKRIIPNPLCFLEKKYVHDFPGKTFFSPMVSLSKKAMTVQGARVKDIQRDHGDDDQRGEATCDNEDVIQWRIL